MVQEYFLSCHPESILLTYIFAILYIMSFYHSRVALALANVKINIRENHIQITCMLLLYQRSNLTSESELIIGKAQNGSSLASDTIKVRHL